MPRHSTDTTFKPGHHRTEESIRKQKETIKKLVEAGLWVPQQESSKQKNRVPNPKKASYGPTHNKYRPVGTIRLCRNHYSEIKVAEPAVWKYVHRAIMETKLGRPLIKGEIVHHLDGDKQNNNPDNLILTTMSKHSSLPKNHNGHPRCAVCGYRHPPHA